MSVDIRELEQVEDLRELSELFGEVWGRAGESLGPDILKALAHSGAYVSAAYRERRLVGGLVGWLGGVPPHEIHVHSHILGVLPSSDARGIGFELKQHQRRWCLARGITVMEWTTDPLVRRNAYFNLTKLGASAPRYLVNFYGEMSDEINAGEESDRLLIRWKLDSPEAEAAAAGRPQELDVEALIERGAVVLLSVGDDGEPATPTPTLPRLREGAGLKLCRVPEDIVALRRSEPAKARAWRFALRSALRDAMESGHTVTAATRSGWYVLEAPAT